jgi:hypothetical protein
VNRGAESAAPGHRENPAALLLRGCRCPGISTLRQAWWRRPPAPSASNRSSCRIHP